ncbi:probable serine/threonine-protein kinase PBL21 isoform X1 [Coffea arabica]|uniref:Probable serine/threonine-protein kinase PBL21 isoform X1 n=1 Tax=Coffea arabica TaxID=13443 RepID=A0ABM4UQB9_COFAR
MSSAAQKILVIQDASVEPCGIETVTFALRNFPLKIGDKIRLLRIIQPFRTEATCSSTGCMLLARNKSKLHSSATHRKKQNDMMKEIQSQKESLNSAKITEVRMLAEQKQVELELAVDVGSLKEIAVDTAKKFEATMVILDRHLKKFQKYFLDNLSCGILRIKRDNSIKYMREPKATEVGQSNRNQKACIRGQQEDITECYLCSLCKTRRAEIGHTRKFSYCELQFTTSNFSAKNLLADRRWKFYEGTLSDGQRIVIREHTSPTIEENEFIELVQKLGKARHENVAMLLGSCSVGSHRLLVYEYICNGSLNRHLSNKSCELTWERRVKIALGAAKALEYLHSLKIYGIMRPSNILLTHDHQPLLVNFGLAKNQYESSNQSYEARVLKTFEYMAPECEESGICKSKADVYSLGVVLLELVTGRKSIDETNGQSFLRWARPLLREKRFHELIDPALQDSHDLHQLYWMVQLTEKCLCWDPHRRCSINKVVVALTCIIQGCIMEDLSPTESELVEQIRSETRAAPYT